MFFQNNNVFGAIIRVIIFGKTILGVKYIGCKIMLPCFWIKKNYYKKAQEFVIQF